MASVVAPADMGAPLRAVTFYQRTLPPSCVSYTSPKGKELFSRALAAGTLEAFFPLSSQFVTQNETTYCGLGTLVMVLNALGVDPQQTWKGVWRFYDSSMLDCCRPLSAVLDEGLTFAEFVCLARCNGLEVESFVPSSTAPSEVEREEGVSRLRRDIMRATSAYSPLLAISYSRRTLGQTGDGHFSPIGAYDEASDHALVMDVARFKYPSYWVPVPLLYDSMLPLDKTTRKPRGYALLSVSARLNKFSSGRLDSLVSPAPPVLPRATLALHKASWASLNRALTDAILRLKPPLSADDVVAAIRKVLTSRPLSPVTVRPGEESAFSELSFRDSSPLRRLGGDPADAVFILSLFSEADGTGPLASVMDASLRQEMASWSSAAMAGADEETRREVDGVRQQTEALKECCLSEGEACGCDSTKFA